MMTIAANRRPLLQLAVAFAGLALVAASSAPATIIYEYDASKEVNTANATWEPNVNNSDIHNGGTDKVRNLSLNGVTANDNPGSAYSAITRAYTFNATAANPGNKATTDTHAGDNPTLYAGSDSDNNKRSSAFEVWFRPNRSNWSDVGTNGDANTDELLFENGGGNGAGLGIRQTANGADLAFSIARNSNTTKITHALTDAADNGLLGDFNQIVGVVDPTHATKKLRLYFNGQPVADTNSTRDWWNQSSDDSGVGSKGGSNTGGFGNGNDDFESFVGDIAIARLYDAPLTDQEVLDSYNAIPEPATVGLLVLGGGVLLVRRRRRAV